MSCGRSGRKTAPRRWSNMCMMYLEGMMMQMDNEKLEVLRAMLAEKDEKEKLLTWMNERNSLLGQSETAVYKMAAWLNNLWADPETSVSDSIHCAVALCLCLITMRQVYGIGGKSFRKSKDVLAMTVDAMSALVDGGEAED